MACQSMTCYALNSSWAETEEKKEATLTINYRLNPPFLSYSQQQNLGGLEYDMMIGFKYYLLNKYGIKVEYNWVQHPNFRSLFQFIEHESSINDFGIDIISKTEERASKVAYSDPYFPDIQVLISKRSGSIASNQKEFKTLFNDATAISVEATTYDRNLQEIKSKLAMNFDIKYLDNSTEIINYIQRSRDYFGYTDLPSYLLAINDDIPVIRHNVFPVRGEGFCIIFNKSSDWLIPFDEYLSSEEFRVLQKDAIQRYLGSDVNSLINSIEMGENEELTLLKQEKKYINDVLTEKAEQVEKQSFVRNVLIVTIILALMVAYFLFNRNRIKTTANEVLTLHRKMIESQNKLLSRRNEELIELNDEKNNFIHILSHDLRAPINNINGLSQLLLLDGKEKLDEDQLRIINHISKESRRLNKMVTRILDVERIESKSMEEFRPIDISKVLEAVIKNYEQAADEKDISFDTKIRKGIYAMGLEQFLFHVMENLLSNALKFSPHGKKIKISSKLSGQDILVSITDQGPGMTEEDKKNMFKKFQVLSAKATGGERSTGLGLSIVQKYVALLNGSLECTSELGQGTTFTVTLSKVKKNQSVAVSSES